MVTNEQRTEAARVFEEVVEAWGQVKRAVAPDLRPWHAPKAGTPEVGLSGTLLLALSARGYDLDVDGFVGTYVGEHGVKYDEPSAEVPDLPPGEYRGMVRATDGLNVTLEAVLRQLWSRATGHLPSQPRYRPPVARLSFEVEAAVADAKARLREYTRPDAEPTRAPARPPYYVVVLLDGRNERPPAYTVKKTGLDAKQRPLDKDRPVPAARLTGIVKKIMYELTERYLAVERNRLHIRKDLDIAAARRAFLKLQPVKITYDDLLRLTSPAGRTRKKDEALAELSLAGRPDLKKAMNTVRRQIARFNQFWRGETGDKGTWLAPDPDATNGGVWKLQTMLLLPPPERGT